MDRKFFVAWVVIFVAWMAGSYVAHGALLHADYEKLAGAFRTPAEAAVFPVHDSRARDRRRRVRVDLCARS